MEDEIGQTAGVVWRYLSEHGGTTLAKLKRGTELLDAPLLMAIGWLAREGKVNLVRDKKGLQISLRSP